MKRAFIHVLHMSICALCLFVSIATAQTTTPTAPENSPARLRLDSLEGLAARAHETVDVSLDGAALRLATQIAGDNDLLKNLPQGIDPALVRELLTGLQGVYIRVYEFKQSGGYTDANVEPILAQLRSSGWSRLFSVNKPGSEGDKVDIFAANDPTRNDRLNGMALIVREPKELVVGYVVGSINTDTVMKLIEIFKKMEISNSQGKQPTPPANKQ